MKPRADPPMPAYKWLAPYARTWPVEPTGGAAARKRRTLVACMPTEITHNEIKSGAVVVSVAGKLMIGSQGEQIVTLVENLLKEGKRTIIFNLGGVTTID